MQRAYNCESFFCICSSYNSGVSFSRTQKPFLWNAIIQKHRASVSQGPGEDSLTSISHQLKDTAGSVGIYTDRPSVIFQFPDSAPACAIPPLLLLHSSLKCQSSLNKSKLSLVQAGPSSRLQQYITDCYLSLTFQCLALFLLGTTLSKRTGHPLHSYLFELQSSSGVGR